MVKKLEESPEEKPKRVRMRTRPYVGAMDWYPPINTNFLTDPESYFGVVDIDGYFEPGKLWRYRRENGSLFEEHWSPKNKSWESTRHLTRMITGGECSCTDMTPEQAQELVPEAFEDKDQINNV